MIDLVEHRAAIAGDERLGLRTEGALQMKKGGVPVCAEDGLARRYGILERASHLGAGQSAEHLVGRLGLPASAANRDGSLVLVFSATFFCLAASFPRGSRELPGPFL